MIFTTKMKQLIAVVLGHDSEKVTKELLRQGVLDVINITSISADTESGIQPVTPRISLARVQEMRGRIESFLRSVDITPSREKQLEVEDLRPLDLDETEKELDSLSSSIESKRSRQSEIQQELLKLEDMGRQLEMFEGIEAGMKSRSRYSFLSIQTGTIPEQNRETFREQINQLPSVHIESEHEETPVHLLITMKRDDKQVNTILEKVGWQDVELPKELEGAREKATRNIEEKIQEYRREQQKLEDEVGEIIREKKENLEDIWANLTMNELFYKMQAHFGKTSRTMVFSGWLPEDQQQELEEGIRRVTDNLCYLEWREPVVREQENPELDAPVEVHTPRVLQPFQALVENYATPEYGTVNPAPFVAGAYLIMFGLMFGDVGHGAVLFLAGIIGTILTRKKGKNSTLFELIIWCGGSAIVAGILFGSYFGMQWFPPLWFDYHGVISGHAHSGSIQDIYDILTITIYFGISVIGLGLLLNWINSIRRRRWFQLIFDKGGIIGGWIYAAGVYAAYYFTQHEYKELPDMKLLFPLIGIPVLILMVKPPLEFFIHRGKTRKSFNAFTIMDFIMEWIVEILEIVSGYLANTLSFMRVAGLGIAHVSLMIAFFSIAEMISPESLVTVGGIVILILGNMLVIVLEGLSAGIQSLRLNYYEFFSKYFNGTGRAYAPISLKTVQ
jgi:V/A-type H+-transporting ATPase subunit I